MSFLRGRQDHQPAEVTIGQDLAAADRMAIRASHNRTDLHRLQMVVDLVARWLATLGATARPLLGSTEMLF
jgi:hypothetical protein